MTFAPVWVQMEARTKGRKVKAIESFVNFSESQHVVGEKRKFTHGWGSDSEDEEEIKKADSDSEDEMEEVHTSGPMSVAPVPVSAPISVPTTSVPVSVPVSAPVSVPAAVPTSSAASKSTVEAAAVPTGKAAGKKGWTAIRTSMVDDDNPFIVEGSAGPAKKVTVRKAGTK